MSCGLLGFSFGNLDASVDLTSCATSKIGLFLVLFLEAFAQTRILCKRDKLKGKLPATLLRNLH
jgi:hypothetical protein